MISPVEYHTHTDFSPDCKYSMETMCAAAVAAGVVEIAFTDHADFEPLDEAAGYLDPDGYAAALRQYREKYAGRLTIRAGVELGDPHRYADRHRELLAKSDFDFAIGSLHWVNGRCTCTRAYFHQIDCKEAYIQYFSAALEAVEKGDFDVMGHLDVPKRRGETIAGRFDPLGYEDLIRPVLRRLVEKGLGIEINTSGWRSPACEPCPSLTILRWFREEGGEIVTIGADAHRPEHIGYGFAEALAILRAAGFHYLATFELRRPTFLPI